MTTMSIDPDTGPSPLQWLLAELDRMPGCARTKAGVRALLASMVGQRLTMTRRDLVRPQQRQLARALLDAGFSAQQTRAELVARLALGRDTAERLVTAALTERAEQGIRRRSAQAQADRAQMKLFDRDRGVDESD
jgi:hypothetical protein